MVIHGFLLPIIPWHDHKFLESKAPASMRSTIEDVHKGYRKDERLLRTCEIGDMCVEREFLETCKSRKRSYSSLRT